MKKYEPVIDKSYDCGGPLDGWGISNFRLKLYIEQVQKALVKALTQ